MLISVCSGTKALAYDEGEDPSLEYAYNHAIDLQLGTGRNLTNYSELPDQGIGVFGHDSWGFDFTLRYTRFFSHHWGAFLQFGLLILDTDYYQMEEPLAKHFNHGGKEVRIDDIPICGFFGSCGSSYDKFQVGAAYRYDLGRWSFRPRLGLGIMRQDVSRSYFYVVDTNTQDTFEEVRLYSTNSKGQTVIIPAFAYSPAIQICFSTSSHFYLSAEAEFTGTIGHLYQRTIAKQFRTDEPNDWQPDEFGNFFIPSYDEFVRKTDDHLTRVPLGNFLQIRIGLGWNIGWNRNEKRMKK